MGALPAAARVVGVLALVAAAGGAGWWFGVQSAAPPPEPDRRRLVESRSQQADLLAALGYVDGLVDPEADRRGVLQHVEGAASPGLSLYYSRTQQQAQLIELDGRVRHTWAAETPAAWQHVELDPRTGDIVVLMKDVGLVGLDRDGNQRWEVEGRFHHDLQLDEQGRIWVLAREARRMPELHADLDILEDFVELRAPDGELIERWSVLEMLRTSPYAFLLPDLDAVKARPGGTADLDLLHTNHVERFDGRLAGLSPLFAQGNLMLSLRNINTVLIVDGRSREILWVWGPGNVTFQHHPVLLDDGHILLFDNGTERSRVLELDPLSLEVTWRYSGPPSFYSETRGSVQRLANGNTLVTISDPGYVREVDPEGRLVWEFANPDVQPDGLRGAIWRMTRYPPGSLPFLEGTIPGDGGPPRRR